MEILLQKRSDFHANYNLPAGKYGFGREEFEFVETATRWEKQKNNQYFKTLKIEEFAMERAELFGR